jgi:hypothetical protein
MPLDSGAAAIHAETRIFGQLRHDEPSRRVGDEKESRGVTAFELRLAR